MSGEEADGRGTRGSSSPPLPSPSPAEQPIPAPMEPCPLSVVTQVSSHGPLIPTASPLTPSPFLTFYLMGSLQYSTAPQSSRISALTLSCLGFFLPSQTVGARYASWESCWGNTELCLPCLPAHLDLNLCPPWASLSPTGSICQPRRPGSNFIQLDDHRALSSWQLSPGAHAVATWSVQWMMPTCLGRA